MELAQKLNRRFESVRLWFKKRRAEKRKQMDEDVEEKITVRKKKGKNAEIKPKTGKFCEETLLILLASFDANPYPDRHKLFYHSLILEKF